MENCPCCEIKDKYIGRIIDAESVDEVVEVVFDLFEEAREYGFKDAIVQDIRNKIDFLDSMEEEKCDCGYC